jgi:probable phosphoglycerate mutase
VLIRHGQSEWNREHRVQGQSGTGLSDVGRRQAEATAAWTAEAHPDAVLVASDLQRCRETAAPLAAALASDVTYDPEVRERRFGRWEGMLLSEVEARDPDLWSRWRDGEDVVGLVGGETGQELGVRAAAAFQRHLEDLDDGATLVMVTHGGPIWHGLHCLLDLRPGTLGGVGNTAVTEVGIDGGSRWLETWNQTAHLPVDLRTFLRPRGARRKAPVVGR